MEDNAIKKFILKKCLIALGFYLFFTVIFPFKVVGNIMVVNASSTEDGQNDIKLNVKSKLLVKDTTYALKLYNINDRYKVTYKSNANSIASVDDNGVITAVDFGDATITATVKHGYKTITSLPCEVTVGPSAFSVVLTKSEVTLSVGRRYSLTAILKVNNTVEEAKFSSNDPEVATVSVGGRIKAKKVGVTYIFASIQNGKYDMCKVTVVERNQDEDTSDSESSDN